MNVRQLIAELSTCPPDANVRFFVAWDDERTVMRVSPQDADDFVVLGDNNLPAEKYGRDYKDE